MTKLDFGVGQQEFRERLFEKECWLKRGGLTLEQPFSLDEIEDVLQKVEPSAPDLQLFHRGPIPEYAFTRWVEHASGVPRRELDMQRFRRWLATGATLVINHMETYSRRAARLCEAVHSYVAFPTMANAYVSYGGDGSFGAHWDTHDVVVAQLVGRRRWRVYPPTHPLPLPVQTSRASGQAPQKTPVLDVTLEVGDLLYLPRGWWHDVTPLPEPSLHLSIGIFVPSVLDVLGWLCQRSLPAELVARRGALDDKTVPNDLAKLLDVLRSQLADPSIMARFRREFASQEQFQLGAR